ncbi:MAG: Gfo/Idh/MocA family oxidoreductase [Telmatospirillum sp.]|nr:Gfo/Idh/MocA family oxidoreductase [Telmatospirillum sp.]
MSRVRWGMIGCGAVTEVKSGPGLYKADRSSLLAVTSIDAAMTASFAERHHVPRTYDTVAGLLADPDLDAVYIATPPASHRPLALEVARAGKHVYVEKPMALRFGECQEIIDACDAAGVTLFVAYYRRAMPRFLQVRSWIEEGAIGEVRTVRAVQHQPPAPEDLSPETLPWRLKPEVAGGGKFLDMAIHTIDILDFLFGPVTGVQGIASNQGGLYEVEDTVNAVWRHESGVQGYGSWCYVAGEGQDQVEIVGSKGRIEMEFFSDRPLRLITAGSVREVDIANPAHVQQPFIQTIVDELTGTGRCPGDAASAARASRFMDAVLADYRREKGF